ncbi:hypothetical protein ONZ45_g6692 [Pleurotus djamor]|nr:hypothetical protein ONZ45_g6692 [Pleurotus djamor]
MKASISSVKEASYSKITHTYPTYPNGRTNDRSVVEIFVAMCAPAISTLLDPFSALSQAADTLPPPAPRNTNLRNRRSELQRYALEDAHQRPFPVDPPNWDAPLMNSQGLDYAYSSPSAYTSIVGTQFDRNLCLPVSAPKT